MDPLQALRMTLPVEPLDAAALAPKTAKTEQAGFGELFEQAVSRVEQANRAGQEKVDSLLRGEDQELTEVVLAAQRAELPFEYFLM